MNSTLPQRRGSGRPAFLLLSVLALLAFACFPVLAQASEESSGVQYETAVPTVKGHTTPPNTPGSSPAHSSTVPGGSPANGSKTNASHSPGNPSSTNGNPSTGSGGGTTQTAQGNDSTANPEQQAGAISGGQPVSSQSAADDSSSSPLIPILIAIAVLAAISIGVVVIRQRRQRQSPGARVSPKAS